MHLAHNVYSSRTMLWPSGSGRHLLGECKALAFASVMYSWRERSRAVILHRKLYEEAFILFVHAAFQVTNYSWQAPSPH